MAETFAIELLLWGYGYTSCNALAVALGHVGLVLEKEPQPLGLQDRTLALAAYSACIGSVAATAALEASIIEIELGDATTAITDK
jgi:hypothetical protein